MKQENNIVKPGVPGAVTDEMAATLPVPEGWAFLPAGDAAVTKKVTAKGLFRRVHRKMGRRIISTGIWAPAATISAARHEVEALRSTDTYRKKLESGRLYREKKQAEYEMDFCLEVRAFLAFAPRYRDLEKKMAAAITLHATPVGSGTVARTTMIPVAERAEKAVTAWMRHQTTAYESMRIPRIKGKRREIRRMLASRSAELLQAYRDGLETPTGCPLKKALEKLP